MSLVSNKFFLDTNILVYTFDNRFKSKQIRANALVEHQPHRIRMCSFRMQRSMTTANPA